MNMTRDLAYWLLRLKHCGQHGIITRVGDAHGERWVWERLNPPQGGWNG